jgi:hypothetical protein
MQPSRPDNSPRIGKWQFRGPPMGISTWCCRTAPPLVLIRLFHLSSALFDSLACSGIPVDGIVTTSRIDNGQKVPKRIHTSCPSSVRFFFWAASSSSSAAACAFLASADGPDELMSLAIVVLVNVSRENHPLMRQNSETASPGRLEVRGKTLT